MSLVSGCAVVTGAGSGIGRAIAQRLAGAAVAIMDVLPEGGAETAAAISASGGRAIFVAGDVGQWADVDRAVMAAVEAFGPLGIMVNAAGIFDGVAATDETTLALWEHVIRVNLTGTFLGCRRALTELVPRGAGRIINIASVAGLVGTGGGAAYTAAKHGVVGLTRQLAVSHADRGITVNAICPGAVSTRIRENSTRILGGNAPPMRAVAPDEAVLRALIPAGRRATTEEIAAVASFIASEDAGYITGHALAIDGGWTAK